MPTALTGDKVLRLKNTAVATKIRSKHIPVTGDKSLQFLAVWQASGTSVVVGFKVEWYSDKATLLSTSTIFSQVAAASNTWETGSGIVAAPATARWCRMTLEKDTTTENVYFDRIEMDSAALSALESNFKAYYSADDTSPGAESTWLTFETDTEARDFGGNYDLSADDFTAPVDGVYLLFAQIHMTSDGAGMTALQCRIQDTGAAATLAEDNASFVPDPGAFTALHAYAAANVEVELDAGDTVEAQYWYTDAGDATAPQVEGGASGQTEFHGRLLYKV